MIEGGTVKGHEFNVHVAERIGLRWRIGEIPRTVLIEARHQTIDRTGGAILTGGGVPLADPVAATLQPRGLWRDAVDAGTATSKDIITTAEVTKIHGGVGLTDGRATLIFLQAPGDVLTELVVGHTDSLIIGAIKGIAAGIPALGQIDVAGWADEGVTRTSGVSDIGIKI